eukprot:CAMPEP_0118867082 /NCGR_PEP_ID=MMETSP1163-20130328/10798_1 /TAXON_ID=124430 /ORGANISM="Phaeomonas parva, Strain CCMP2877" /LENGTH=405 /DNA_ID=CAMNT_0006801459 /DNA_START=170 /DNA_END=1384 /DNA_ORIENTATION=+
MAGATGPEDALAAVLQRDIDEVVLDALGTTDLERTQQEALIWPGTTAPSRYTVQPLPARTLLRSAPKDRIFRALESDATLAEALAAVLPAAAAGDVLVEDAVDETSEAQLVRRDASSAGGGGGGEAMSFTKGNMGAEGAIYAPGGTENPDPLVEESFDARQASAAVAAGPSPEEIAAALAPLRAGLNAEGVFTAGLGSARGLRGLPAGDFYETADPQAAASRLAEPSPNPNPNPNPNPSAAFIATPSAAQLELVDAAAAPPPPPNPSPSPSVDPSPKPDPNPNPNPKPDPSANAGPPPPPEAAAEMRRWEGVALRLRYGFDREEEAAVFEDALKAAHAIAPPPPEAEAEAEETKDSTPPKAEPETEADANPNADANADADADAAADAAVTATLNLDGGGGGGGGD